MFHVIWGASVAFVIEPESEFRTPSDEFQQSTVTVIEPSSRELMSTFVARCSSVSLPDRVAMMSGFAPSLMLYVQLALKSVVAFIWNIVFSKVPDVGVFNVVVMPMT